MRRFSLLALSMLAACEPPTPEVDVDITLETPMNVDIFQDQCQVGDKFEPEPFWTEEMCAMITVPTDDWYIEARQVALDFDDYCVEYLIQNENGTLEKYCNGMQLHLDGGEKATIPLRAVAFSQKLDAWDQFGGSVPELQVKATLTMFSTNRWNNEQIETVVDYDIIMADYDNCAGITTTCDASPPVALE
jgi:hypothetical protein